eukprot:g5754.t1
MSDGTKTDHQLNPQRSKKLLERFLSSTDFQTPRPSSPWENNPLLQELARSVKTTADFEYIEGLLRDDDKCSALISTLYSMTSTGTIDSSKGSELTTSGSVCSMNRSLFSTITTTSTEASHSRQSFRGDNEPPQSFEESLNQQNFDAGLRPSPNQTRRQRASLEISEIQPADDDEEDNEDKKALHQKIRVPVPTIDALQKFEGVWKFKKHSKSDVSHIHRIIDLDKSQIKRNLEKNSNFEIKVNKDVLSMRTEIVGLCHIDVPLSGALATADRFDLHEGSMEVHVEARRAGFRLIYTWEHPLAGTRRDTFEISACGNEMSIVGYITRRNGTNCKAKWAFVRINA